MRPWPTISFSKCAFSKKINADQSLRTACHTKNCVLLPVLFHRQKRKAKKNGGGGGKKSGLILSEKQRTELDIKALEELGNRMDSEV